MPRRFAVVPCLLTCVLLAAPAALAATSAVNRSGGPAPDDAVGRALADALGDLPAGLAPSGVLLDRVLDLAGAAHYDGSPAAPAADRAVFRQLAWQLARAADEGAGPPAPADLERLAATLRDGGAVPLVVLDWRVERLRPDAFASGALAARGGRVFAVRPAAAAESRRVVAAAALAPPLRRGGEVAFVLDPRLVLSSEAVPPRSFEVDFADGRGWRAVATGERVRVRYGSTGAKSLRVRFARADGSTAFAAAELPVAALAAPLPDDTLFVTAAEPYLGVYGTGRAYVRYAPGHTSLVNPIVVPEGFDLDNSMHWDELYALLNQHALAETIAAHGFDAVVLDFTDATDHVQRNAFVVAELLREVDAALPPGATMAVVGPSMGGLCSRYALAWLESRGEAVRARTWIAFDTPFDGADIPLGLQYWIDFFAGQSADADTFRTQLNSPAARQMLAYHYTLPPGTTGAPDPLRAPLMAEFDTLGWPQLPRRVAVANGSARRANQGFLPGDALIQWSYSNLIVTILGNVWAVPNGTSRTIFDGRIRILFSDTRRTVTVNGTQPWDGAPGGYRGSLAQLDTVAAPYGDIRASHPNHCFVPVVSSLAIAGATDPFYDVAGDPDLLAHTPFDALFVPDANEEHVAISAASAAWLVAQLEQGATTGAGEAAARGVRFAPPAPNPSRGDVRLAFVLPAAARVNLRVYDVAGREVAGLLEGALVSGAHEVRWNGRDARGAPAGAGLYFARLRVDGEVFTRRIARVP